MKVKKSKKVIIFLTTIILTVLTIIGLYKKKIYRYDNAKNFIKKIEFKLNTHKLKIPEDALFFSVYDISDKKYLYYEGENQLPTVASLTKLFVIDYAMTKVKLEDKIKVDQELLDIVPKNSSLANLVAGEYTAKQIIEGMLVPSGNDAAYALAYHIAKKTGGWIK